MQLTDALAVLSNLVLLAALLRARRDGARYRKLRGWMSCNVPEGWREVECLGALAAWVSWDVFDGYLDSLPRCTVGLMSPPAKPTPNPTEE